MNYTAVIQAGGKGTRLAALTENKIPKPMLKMNGKPVLEWQIENIKKYGIKNFIIIIGHLGDKIKDYFGNGTRFGVEIEYIQETEPLGSAGALYYVKKMTENENILLIFGDLIFDVNLNKFIDFHSNNNAMATLLVHPNSHPYDSDLIVCDEKLKITGFCAKNTKRDYWYNNCVNAGMYILSKTVLDKISFPVKTDLEKDILFPLIKSGKIYGYKTPEYVKDTGTVDRFLSVEKDLKNGTVSSKALINKQKCIFLDRDGTINKYKGLISCEEDFELEESVAEAIKLINKSGYLAIVATNQPVVARGLCDISDVENIHRKMQVLLGNEGAYLDDIIFCPHHPDKGYPEENPLYKIPCECRKPKTAMIDKMIEKYDIDREKSYYIGDTTIDIKTGENAGLHTVLVKTGEAGKDGKYNAKAETEAENLFSAVKLILSGGMT